jgi:hypothetical protein
MYIFLWVCVYIYIYIHTHPLVHIHTYIYTYIQAELARADTRKEADDVKRALRSAEEKIKVCMYACMYV